MLTIFLILGNIYFDQAHELILLVFDPRNNSSYCKINLLTTIKKVGFKIFTVANLDAKLRQNARYIDGLRNLRDYFS